MFLSDSHLPQILPASAYQCEATLAVEQEKIFLPSWHFVGWADSLKQDGDFLTDSFFGHPVIVWRKQDELRAFLNVCAHRFSKLTNASCGNTDRLTCQYHGWQYNECGDTQRIPDAQSFKPLESGKLGLTKLKVKQLGKLIFIQLPGEHPVDFEQQLGPASELLLQSFTPRHQLLYSSSVDVAANWKLIVENAIESYHVSFIHSKSFGEMPDATSCTHRLDDTFTCFQTNSPSQAHWLVRKFEHGLYRVMGTNSAEKYQHLHVYPNLLVSTTKFITVLMLAQPKTPQQTRFDIHVFGDPGPYRNAISQSVFWFASQFAIRQTLQVLQEDFDVLPSIQAGINSPQRPGEGLISIREERIHHFQQTLLKKYESQ